MMEASFPRRRCLSATALALLVLPLGAQQPARPAPPRRTLAPYRVERIDHFMQAYVDSNRIGGAVGLVVLDGKVVYQHAVGWADKDAGRRMTPEVIFRIASQSKAITSAAILALVEEGRIALSDPVSRYIPAFARTSVMLDTGNVTVPAHRQITIRDLLTHTAGISYGTDASVAARYAATGLGPAAGWGWYTADKDEPVCTTMERLATVPFAAQPGTAFVYGYSLDILGCVVERASGVPLDRFIHDRITAPLRMTDTHFFLPPGERTRLTEVFASDSTGHAVRAPDGPRGQGDYVDGPRMNFSGGAGLLSTASDYARFLSMILNGGALDGARILAPHTVDLMTHDQIGTLYGSPGEGFGYGFETVLRYGAVGMESVGSFGWGGAYGSTYTVDPAEHLIIVFMINQLPNSSDIAARFSTLVYSALVTRHQ